MNSATGYVMLERNHIIIHTKVDRLTKFWYKSMLSTCYLQTISDHDDAGYLLTLMTLIPQAKSGCRFRTPMNSYMTTSKVHSRLPVAHLFCERHIPRFSQFARGPGVILLDGSIIFCSLLFRRTNSLN